MYKFIKGKHILKQNSPFRVMSKSFKSEGERQVHGGLVNGHPPASNNAFSTI